MLKKILWLDVLMGGSTGLIGLIFHAQLPDVLGLSQSLVVVVSAVTLCYALVALYLAPQAQPLPWLVRTLVAANWIWTAISIGLIVVYFAEAYPLGQAFLMAQVVVVGGLAYVEGRQLKYLA